MIQSQTNYFSSTSCTLLTQHATPTLTGHFEGHLADVDTPRHVQRLELLRAEDERA